jgi:acyl carrier protein
MISSEPCHALSPSNNFYEESQLSNRSKYVAAFTSTFMVDEVVLPTLKYQDIGAWDSVGHMALMTALEETFGIEMDIDDIIEFSSFVHGQDILSKYKIELD